MTMNDSTLIIILVATIIACMIILALQLALSSNRNNWLGLILPIICLVLAVGGSIGIMAYTGDISSVVMVFMLFLTPAIINYIIYRVCRAKYTRKNSSASE